MGRRASALLLLSLSLLALAAAATGVETELTLEESDDEALLNRCFLPGAVLEAMQGSRISIQGGGLIGSGGSQVPINVLSTTSDGTTTGTVTESDEGGQTAPRGSGAPATREEPSLPGSASLIYGQLKDERGVALGGEQVVLEWIDSDGVKQRAVTTTLTREEAIARGDRALEGYYFFFRDRYGLDETTAYTVTRVASAPAAPTVEEATTDDVTGTEEPRTPERRVETVAYTPETTSTFERVAAAAPGAISRYWWIPVALLVAVGAFLLLRTTIAESIAAYQRNRFIGSFGKEAHRLDERKMKELMETRIVTFAGEGRTHDLIGRLLQEEADYALITVDGTPHGIVTVSDILDHPGEEDPRRIASRPISSVDANLPFGKAVGHALRHRVLVVTRNERAVGVVTRHHLLAELDKFFSLHLRDARRMPLVKEVMTEPFAVTTATSLTEILERARKRRASTAFVTTTRSAFGRDIVELQGMLSEHELLEELYSYAGMAGTMDAGRIMTGKRRGIVEGATILEANKVLLEQQTRAIPVLSGNELKGEIGQRALLASLHRYFADLLATQE